ncbi:MAG: hypothetical protein IKT32_00195, partial [Clostridia bacterium]|nr:hypothetical protein [Clostridia bacterium]
DNKFGPSLGEGARMYTFLTEYFEPNDEYYLVYLKKQLINEYKDYLIEYEDYYKNDPYNYHYAKHDEYTVIDGKYLWCYQKLAENKNENVMFRKANNFSDISYCIQDYQLVFCAQSKNAIIKENISTAKEINRPINLFLRVPLYFSDENATPTRYEFETYENITQANNEKKFNYVGELVQVFPLEYENITFANYPQLGMSCKDFTWETISIEVIKEGKNKYVLLPRYASKNKVDLLDSNVNFAMFGIYEDVFQKHKQAFKDAYYKDYEDLNVHSFYQYGLYDYKKVKKIINGN